MTHRPSHANASGLLFVDDDDNWSFMFRTEFKKVAPDKIVMTARDGAEAIGYLARGGIQILVTDIRMPGMGGIDLIKWIRSQLQDQTRAIVVHSSSEDITDRQQCVLLGVDSFLEKPDSLDAMRANIRFILKVWEESLSYSRGESTSERSRP